MTALTTTSATLSATLPSFPRAPPPHPPVPRLSLRLRPRRRALLRCEAVSELAPAASAAYGVLLLGGGVFACTEYYLPGRLASVAALFCRVDLRLYSLTTELLLSGVPDARSGSKGSIYGGLAGSALMGVVSGPRISSRFPEHCLFICLLEEVSALYSRSHICHRLCHCVMIPARTVMLSRLWKLCFRPSCREGFVSRLVGSTGV